MRINYGINRDDVSIQYTMKIGFSLDALGTKELLYDEINFETSFDLKADNDIVYGVIKKHRIDMPRHRSKKLPVRNTMNMTSTDYNEFISTFGFTNNYIKKWMNDVVLREGIKFPYNMEELYTTLQFTEGAMHIMLEVEKEYEEYLDQFILDEYDAFADLKGLLGYNTEQWDGDKRPRK